jgi:hypothetical protein
MMKGKMEPSTVPIMVKAVPPVVQTIIQTTIIPQMTFPQKR